MAKGDDQSPQQDGVFAPPLLNDETQLSSSAQTSKRSDGDQNSNQAILHFLNEIKPFAASWRAIFVHVSKLSMRSKNQKKIQDACLFLNKQMHGHMARVFLASNQDIIILVQNIGLLKVERFVHEIHHFFKDDPFIQSLKNEPKNTSKYFSKIYNLVYAYDDVVAKVTNLSDLNIVQKMVDEIPLEYSQVLPFDLLVKLQHTLRQANLMNFIRKQSLCMIESLTTAPIHIGYEYYLSMSDIESQASVYSQIMADFGLFKYLSALLDKKMLGFLPHLINKIPPSLMCHINLNLRTIVSKEFFDFQKKLNRPCTVEMDRTDLLWNRDGVRFAMDLLKGSHHAFCLDLITSSNISLFLNINESFDFYKIITSEDLFSVYLDDLKRLIDNVGPDKIILTRCDRVPALEQAFSLGIRHFQGYLVEHLRAKSAPQ